jgi:hypothetical protein
MRHESVGRLLRTLTSRELTGAATPSVAIDDGCVNVCYYIIHVIQNDHNGDPKFGGLLDFVILDDKS